MLQLCSDSKIILASTSPRRKELMSWLGLPFTISAPAIDETQKPHEDPKAYVERLAKEKALAIAKVSADAWVIGADTTVVLNGVIYGKPEDKNDAVRMLNELQGRTHQVFTGCALVNIQRGITLVRSATTEVTMRTLTALEIAAYVATNEPFDKAGSYAFQGIGGQIIESVTGSPTNIIGLDLVVLTVMLRECGVVS